MDLIYSIDSEDIVQNVRRLLCLQKQACSFSSVYSFEEAFHFFKCLKIWEHDNIRPGLYNGFDFLLRPGIILKGIMNRIDPDQKSGFLNCCPYSLHVFQCMIVYKGIIPLLAVSLPYIFHIYENPVNAILFGNNRHFRSICNIH